MSWLEQEKRRRQREKMKEFHKKWGEGGEMERKVHIFHFKLIILIAAVIWISLMILDWLK